MKPIVELNDSELEEVFGRSSGPGGQNVNKTSTRVTLRHLPTNITVTVQDSRSQAMNRKLARQRLLEALQERQRLAALQQRQLREKQRRQRADRPASVKRRLVENKRKRSSLKQQRGRIQAE